MPEMLRIHEETHLVTADEIDQLGHVNNLEYLKWALGVAVRHSEANGWPFHRYEELGAGWVVRTHTITYLRPAFLGDSIRLRSWIADLSRATCRRIYKMERMDGDSVTIVATAETEWVFIDFVKQTPRRIPPELLASFTALGDAPEDFES